ncbi:asparagine ligase [Saccharothrix sp. ALI-22-I]|uniref:asparagine synthetase A n=1 Tax=Saccharothrix sp. ALI-22-I TaxID=1933778 RepID=UPI00097C41FF|nr:asparagine synthetase A [Saccharothrix sp. ALI-22-I]ONI88798.1 asparagine ligase [Saccharothrix sp. ALI-22-I]
MTQPESNGGGHVLPTPAEHLSSPRTRAVLRVQQRLLAAAREYLVGEQGCMELLPPIIGPVTDPGARGAKQVDIDYYGRTYKLMTSGILYKQAALLGFDRIVNVAPNVRLEPLETASTRRHLAEFHQLDVEIAHASRDEVMDLAEGLLKHVVRAVVDDRAAELELLSRDVAALKEVVNGGFDRRRHADVVAQVRAGGYEQSPDAEIDWHAEASVSEQAVRPFFITDYPKGSRGFYDRESETEPGVLRNFDLIVPEGYGEIASGSEREWDYRRIMTRLRETGENPAKYDWYLDMVRAGIPASAGFGIGVERLTRYLTGVDEVWQASAFPKVPGVFSA